MTSSYDTNYFCPICKSRICRIISECCCVQTSSYECEDGHHAFPDEILMPLMKYIEESNIELGEFLMNTLKPDPNLPEEIEILVNLLEAKGLTPYQINQVLHRKGIVR